MKRIIISMDGQNVIEPSIINALIHIESLLKEGAIGEKFEIEIVEMSDEEYNKLDEFMGW